MVKKYVIGALTTLLGMSIISDVKAQQNHSDQHKKQDIEIVDQKEEKNLSFSGSFTNSVASTYNSNGFNFSTGPTTFNNLVTTLSYGNNHITGLLQHSRDVSRDSEFRNFSNGVVELTALADFTTNLSVNDTNIADLSVGAYRTFLNQAEYGIPYGDGVYASLSRDVGPVNVSLYHELGKKNIGGSLTKLGASKSVNLRTLKQDIPVNISADLIHTNNYFGAEKGLHAFVLSAEKELVNNDNIALSIETNYQNAFTESGQSGLAGKLNFRVNF